VFDRFGRDLDCIISCFTDLNWILELIFWFEFLRNFQFSFGTRLPQVTLLTNWFRWIFSIRRDCAYDFL